MKNKATLQIIEQLKDSSHPPIVLLDGAWGIGKTHLIDKELHKEIESNSKEFGTYYYVSAFGIKSVTEFQDQIVSLYISNQKETSSYIRDLTSLTGKLAGMCGADASGSGVIQGVISGTTGFLRQQAIQKMTDITLVVDDLERLTDEKLIAEIMGTCLRFAEHNKIKVIAVANATAFKDKTKVEKSFSDVITLTRTTEELLTIISDIYGEKLDAMVKETFFKTINHAQMHKLDINNLRVLQRAVNRTIKLNNRIRLIEGIDEERSVERLTQHIVLITLYSYSNKLDIDTFVSILENGQKLQDKPWEAEENRNRNQNEGGELTKNEQQQKALFKQLTLLFKPLDGIDSLAEYCFTNLIPELSDEKLIERFKLPRLAKPIDIFKTYNFYRFTSEEEFEEGITQLVYLLFTQTNVNWSDWIACCDIYLFMHERGYLEDDNINDLSKKLEERVLKEGVIDLDTVNHRHFSHQNDSSNQINTTNFKNAINKVIQRSINKQREAITDSFLNDWRTTIYKHKNYIEYQPFFHRIDNERLAEKITQWVPMDIAEFIGFMKNRYLVVNNLEKDRLELPALIELSKQLDLKSECMSGRLKKGAIKDLIIELNIAVTTIEERQKQI